MKHKIGLLPLIILAIILGVVAGNFFPEGLVRVFVTFNAIFGQFLGFMVPLIIVGLVTPAIANIGEARDVCSSPPSSWHTPTPSSQVS